jgi:hypothetical protein
MDLDYKLALQDFINFYEASYIPHFLSLFFELLYKYLSAWGSEFRLTA